MSSDVSQLLASAQLVLATQDDELKASRALDTLSVVAKTATGTGDIDALVSLDRKFRLVYVRLHFVGGTGVAPVVMSVSSAVGLVYDTILYSINRAGMGMDVNLRVGLQELSEPSSWTFQTGDGLRVQWTNPDPGNLTWGLEVGLALAT